MFACCAPAGGLSPGVLAAAVVVPIVVVAAGVGLATWWLLRRRRKRGSGPSPKPLPNAEPQLQGIVVQGDSREGDRDGSEAPDLVMEVRTSAFCHQLDRVV